MRGNYIIFDQFLICTFHTSFSFAQSTIISKRQEFLEFGTGSFVNEIHFSRIRPQEPQLFNSRNTQSNQVTAPSGQGRWWSWRRRGRRRERLCVAGCRGGLFVVSARTNKRHHHLVVACQSDWRTDAAGDRDHLSSSEPALFLCAGSQSVCTD